MTIGWHKRLKNITNCSRISSKSAKNLQIFIEYFLNLDGWYEKKSFLSIKLTLGFISFTFVRAKLRNLMTNALKPITKLYNQNQGRVKNTVFFCDFPYHRGKK